MEGTVKWFNIEKGFGFITPDHDGPDILVRQDAVHTPDIALRKAQRVRFHTVTAPEGLVAESVHPL